MERIPEPELMDDEAQALAYAQADFVEPHEAFVERFATALPECQPRHVLDLGCGPGDVTMRFARRFEAAKVVGVDGSAEMIEAGRPALDASGVADRIELVKGYLPGAALPRARFDTIISNSLLHHLGDPSVLWQTIHAHAEPGASVFIMDLMRPPSREVAQQLVDTYSGGEPEVLRHDFFVSLLAAYRVEEVEAQIEAARLSLKVEMISDRHLIVYGRLPA